MQATRLPPQLLLQHNRIDRGSNDLGEARFNSSKNLRGFTRLRLNRATAWQAVVFLRRVFGRRDRRAKDPRSGRASGGPV